MNPHAYLTDENQIKAVESIKRVDEDGYLYHMDARFDYYQIPDAFKTIIDAGCSTFVAKNLDGDILFCRNYDFSHFYHNERKNGRTGINMIVEADNPSAKYRSIGVADVFWIDYQNGNIIRGVADDGKTDLSGFILAPHICMDGMNEQGLAISILALGVKADWKQIDKATYDEKLNVNKSNLVLERQGEEPDPYWFKVQYGSVCENSADHKYWIADMEWIQTKKPGKPTYLHPIMMRLVLDNCANVDEALQFMDNCNVKGVMPGADYHIMAADKTGKSRLVEWIDGEMIATDINHATNHYVAKQDHFFPLGCGRDEIIKAALFRTAKAGMRQDFVENLLKLVIQDPSNKTDSGKTQYTCIYNLNKKTVKIFSYGDMSKSYEYELK